MKPETLNAIIRTLENTVSDDPTRYHLQYCELSRDLLAATDGHILSQVKISDECLAPLGDAKVYIHRDELGYLKSLAKQWRHGIPNVEVTPERIVVDGKQITSKNPVKYPNWKQFVPRETTTLEVGFDADLLMSLAKVLRESKKNKGVKLKFKSVEVRDDKGNLTDIKIDKTSPIIVVADHSGVLMPMRI